MKAMLAGILLMTIIGFAAWYGLGELGFSSQAVYSGPNVRLD